MEINISIIETNPVPESDMNRFLDILLEKFEKWMEEKDETANEI